MRAVRTLLVAAALLGATACDAIDDGAYAVDASTSSSAAPVVDTEPSVDADADSATHPDPAADPVATAPDAPERARFDPEAEARAREEAARAVFEAEWPMHGIAYHFLAQVRARPDRASAVIGYIRRGTRFRAKQGLRGDGCARGWHEVVGGGFVCRGEGFLLGDRAQSFEPSPISAALEDALPYAYAYVAREDAPQYWRLPSAAEEAQAAALISGMRARSAALAAAATASSEEEGAPSAEPDLEAPPGL
ncbi:MAG: hypothetical protein M3Y87_15200, partial [Myxococcota bacterium]|nr:hypothetical protein [Myxococcota bacterium]